MIAAYLASVRQQFAHQRSLGERTFAQLSDEQLFWQPNPESNSIAIIVKHMRGNMRSRWTDFLTTDGEKEWRDRETEFTDATLSREELLAQWHEGWELVFLALAELNEDNFSTTVYIRAQPHTVLEAINRQLTHYAYHVGQIVFIGKMLADDNWRSLSIPRGGSAAFNASLSAK